MVEVTERRKTMLDRASTIRPTQRVERQRQCYFGRKLVYSIDRDRIEVRVMHD